MITRVKLIPLWLSQRVYLPFWKIGITVNSSQFRGTDSDRQMCPNKLVNKLMKLEFPFLNRGRI